MQDLCGRKNNMNNFVTSSQKTRNNGVWVWRKQTVLWIVVSVEGNTEMFQETRNVFLVSWNRTHSTELQWRDHSDIWDLTCLENDCVPAHLQEVRSYMALSIRAERTCMPWTGIQNKCTLRSEGEKVGQTVLPDMLASLMNGAGEMMEKEETILPLAVLGLVYILIIFTRWRRPTHTFLHEWASIWVFSMGRTVLLHYSAPSFYVAQAWPTATLNFTKRME